MPLRLAATLVTGSHRSGVEGGQDPGGRLRRAAALGELDEGVKVHAALTRQRPGQAGGEAGSSQALTAPCDDLSGQEVPPVGRAVPHVVSVSRPSAFLTAPDVRDGEAPR